MSGEHFETLLTADVRSIDGNVEYAPSFSQQPRLIENGQWNDRVNGWASCHLYAETVIHMAADAIRDQPMDGLTGDHPRERELLAAKLDVLAEAARMLARDHSGNSTFSQEEWDALIAEL